MKLNNIRVLFIAYYFPPMGGAGVQRALKFVKYLPEHGIDPIVLTSTHTQSSRWIHTDNELLKQIGQNIELHRTEPITNIISKNRFSTKIRQLTASNSEFGLAWAEKAIDKGRIICREKQPDIIFTTMSPFEGCVISKALSKEFGIPWVADLRDPWALDEMEIYPSKLHRRIWTRRMLTHLADASLVVMNTPIASQRLTEAYSSFQNQRKPKRVISITNGYDSEDFEEAGNTQRRNEQFTIVHTGSLHTHFSKVQNQKKKLNKLLGRCIENVDYSTRSHIYLIKAIEILLRENIINEDNFKLKLIGHMTDEDIKVVQESTASKLTEIVEFSPHASTVKEQINADLLFLPMHHPTESNTASIVPGKTYEYLAAKRPILGAVPLGDARNYLEDSKLGRICEPNDIDAMAEIIKREFNEWEASNTHSVVDCDQRFISQFERKYLTSVLAKSLKGVLDEREDSSQNSEH